MENEEIIHPPTEAGSDLQNDLFAAVPVVTPEPENASVPPEGKAAEDLPPVVTSGSVPRSPLIFSDANPLPTREGEAPVGRKASSPRPKTKTPVHLDRNSFPQDSLFGDLLRSARTSCGLTVDQVSNLTKLRVHYLTALENSDLGKLPPAVYVAAYVRTLSNLYFLDAESAAFLREKLQNRPDHADVPPTLIQKLETEGQVSEQETKRIRKLFYLAGGGILLICLLAVWGVVAAFRAAHHSEMPPPPAANELLQPAARPELTQDDFDALSGPQLPDASLLRMSSKPSVETR